MDYKDKLKLAKEALDSGSYDKETIEYIFPELAESEDEKIRKELIEFVKSRGGFKQEYIAWLEKQGEQSSLNINRECLKGIKRVQEYQDLSDWEKEFDKIASMYAHNKNQEGYNDSWYVKERAAEMLYYAKKELENQGEKPKPSFRERYKRIANSEWFKKTHEGMSVSDDEKVDNVNKIEPKFKVGDFIVSDYCMGKVIALTDDAYLLDTEQGIPFSCEHNAHLWTIQDAKDGDVLVGKIDGDDYILIFKQIKDGWIETYGHYYDAVDRFCVPSQLFCKDYKGIFYPATKEQRDLLFQKMKDAGYEWDAEKKELRKIDARKNLTLDGDLMQADCMIVEQNQTWSEEDERILDALITSLNNERFAGRLETLKGVGVSLVIDWLKSLKEKIKKEAV